MGRKRYDTSRYGITASKSIKFQLIGAALVVMAVVFGLLLVNGLAGSL
jgi:hypothetical protein